MTLKWLAAPVGALALMAVAAGTSQAAPSGTIIARIAASPAPATQVEQVRWHRWGWRVRRCWRWRCW